MKAIIIIIISTIVSIAAFGQNRNSVWCFGDSAGIDFSNQNNPVPFFSGMDDRGSCASIADTSGNLLFYCFAKSGTVDTGSYVFNYLNDTMINGKFLVGEGGDNQLLILPFPDDSNRYYIFHLGYYSAEGLYYSIVDMSLNGGQGEVIQKNVQLSGIIQGDCIEAVKHGNGRDWWLISKLGGNGATQIDRFYSYRIFPGNNISAPIIQDFGIAVDAVQQKIIINSKSNKIMNINVGGYMAQYDLDRCNGLISNPNIIFPQQLSNFNRYFVSGAYAPNDSLFYVSTWWYSFPYDTSRLLQYNLFAANIPASCDTLFEQRNPNIFNAVRLAPNNKIYMASFYNWGFPGFPYPDSVRNIYNENLSVVNSPNNLGASCNFQPFSFYLGGKRTYASLPNNPNYELGPLYGSPCDSLSAGITDLENKNNATLYVYYHATWQTVFINAQKLKGKNATLKVYDLNGRVVYTSTQKTQSPYFTQDVDVSSLSAGMYIVSLETESEVLNKKFVKQ